MPNTGRPSRDCLSCRQRRIKCDQVRPACNQCARKRQECPGYRDEFSSLLQVETVSSYKSYLSSKSSRRTRSHAGEAAVGQSYSTLRLHHRPSPKTVVVAKDKIQEATAMTLLNSRLLVEPWSDHIMPIAVHSFDFSEKIYGELRLAKEGSALYKATYAFGCAYLANLTQSDNVISNRARAYGLAIASMNSALRDPQQCKKDSTLLGVWLLGAYELFICTQDNSTSAFTKWDIHNQGLTELIRLRGREQFRYLDGRILFFMIFNTMHSRVLVPDRNYFDQAIVWFKEYYQYCPPTEHIVLRAYIFTYHCSRICRDIQKLLDNGDLDVLLRNSQSILQDVEDVENALYPFAPDSLVAKCLVDPPLKPFDFLKGSYTGTSVLRSNYRLRLSHHVLEFVNQACKAPSCTYQQRIMFSGTRNRCLAEIQVLTKKIARFLELISPNRLRAFATMSSSIFLHRPNTRQRHIQLRKTVNFNGIPQFIFRFDD